MSSSGEARSLEVRTADGWDLDLLHLPATGEVQGVALLGHAMMVDRRSMDRPRGSGFASHLAQAGWEVYLADIRGHGASKPAVSDGASWTYDDIIQHDLPACLAAVRERHPGQAVHFVGHSLCGHASVAAAGCGYYETPPEAHVLLSVNMWTPALEPSWWLRRKKGSSVFALFLLSSLFGYFPSRRIGMGPVDEPKDYVSDIVRIWRSGRWGSRDGKHDYLAALSQVPGRILSVVGKGDSLLAHPVGARAWAEHFGEGRADFRLLGRGDLGLDFDPDHMTLVTDERSRPVWDSVLAWMGGLDGG